MADRRPGPHEDPGPAHNLSGEPLNQAFEMITSRVAHTADMGVNKYEAVAINADGRYTRANGTLPFIGMCQYPCDKANQVITVVRGIYPAWAGAAMAKGARVAIDAEGKLIPAAGNATVVGISLTSCGIDELFALQMLDTPAPATA